LSANPNTINRGQSTTLAWQATNATAVTIDPGLGNVGATTGNRQVTPDSSVTYTATATGPGGRGQNTVRVTVNVPAPPPTPPRGGGPVTTVDPLDDFIKNVKTIYFDYDKSDIRSDQIAVLQNNATYIKGHPNVRFTIEGHCDERGSQEYNLALGDRRANAVKQYLASQGVTDARMMTQSFGEEKPVCTAETEECFAMNRRAAFTPSR